MKMDHPIATASAAVAGVKSVVAAGGKLHIEFADGTKATVVPSQLARISGRHAVDVWFPNANPGAVVQHEVAPNLSNSEALDLLGRLASQAAKGN